MATAWKVFDTESCGFLKAESFSKVLPLLGENVPPAEIDALFQDVDTDGSGRIEFPEFCVMVKRMNPSEEDLKAKEAVVDEAVEVEPAKEVAENVADSEVSPP